MHADNQAFVMPPSEVVERAAVGLRLLADPTRIKIMWALAQGESNVGCLADLADAPPAAVSQHLAKLRLAGIVLARRQGTFIYYSIADRHIARVLADAVEHAAHDTDDIDVDAAVTALKRAFRSPRPTPARARRR